MLTEQKTFSHRIYTVHVFWPENLSEAALSLIPCVYELEFDYDYRVYITMVMMAGPKRFIKQTLGWLLHDYPAGAIGSESIAHTLWRSTNCYVTIHPAPDVTTRDELTERKYDMIYRTRAFYPLGLNMLCYSSFTSPTERNTVRYLMNRIAAEGLTDFYKSQYTGTALLSGNTARAVIEYRVTNAGKKYANPRLEKVTRWPSVSDAAKYYGISRKYISQCCNGHMAMYKNRIWKFE